MDAPCVSEARISPPVPSAPSNTPPTTSLEEIRETYRRRTQEIFNVRPCLWQIKVLEARLDQKGDIVVMAGTGMGKTLTFWMPVLFHENHGIQIVVTPLNALGKQNVRSLEKTGISAIFIGADSANGINYQAIEMFEYRVVVCNNTRTIDEAKRWLRKVVPQTTIHQENNLSGPGRSSLC